jgi:hypothetical protein
MKISNIRDNFDVQLTAIQTSVEQLTSKVNTQYCKLSSAAQSLVDTIAKTYFITAGIQQVFIMSMETLSKPLISSNSSTHITSSTGSQQRFNVEGWHLT